MKKIRKKRSTSSIWILSSMGFIFISCMGLFLLYSPSLKFSDWIITTAMTTRSHQYLATLFYSNSKINEVMNRNTVIENNTSSNPNLIQEKTVSYEDEFDQAILENDEETPYKLIPIEENGYKGFLVAIYDPSKVQLGITRYLNNRGELLPTMAANYNALVAINASGFSDPDGIGDGGMPVGGIVQNRILVWNSIRPYSSGGVIGFNKENKLILTKDKMKDAIQTYELRDAMEFGPFLIVDGVPSTIQGNGGWGTAPRTVIGQRKDGIVLFLVIDGRRPGYSMGAEMADLTAIMTRYKAFNAANLDGGSSSCMFIEDQIVNRPTGRRNNGLRHLPNMWYIAK